MASRQVTLLKKGYYSGRLTFNYNQPYSRLRESFILEDIEQEAVADVLAKKVVLDAQIIPLNPKAAKGVYGIIDKYTELTLPYLSKTDKISDTAPGASSTLSEDEKAYWRKVISERKKLTDG